MTKTPSGKRRDWFAETPGTRRTFLKEADRLARDERDARWPAASRVKRRYRTRRR